MATSKKESYLHLISTEQLNTSQGVAELLLHTDNGSINTRYHAAGANGSPAVIWVGGAGGGLDGPAGGMYPRLAQKLTQNNIASLRLHYRFPNHLPECVLDTQLGVEYLRSIGHSLIALVGHSFGGAVVISAGAQNEHVTGVVAMSSQTYGTEGIRKLSPRPLLLMHGTADEVLPDACSRDLYARALEPKELKLYPKCRHGLDLCRDQVDHDLLLWLVFTLAIQAGEI
jgi:pimeloyl-ACP methyl ester carboxylesterase